MADVVTTGQVPAGMSPDQEDEAIRSVNEKYNNLITYKDQPSNDGKGTGGWQLNDLPEGGEGDCDTYARTKGEALVKAGIPSNKLSIVVAKMWNGVDHAVLKVDRGNGKAVYLSNPINGTQRQNPNASILDELPGKDAGVNLYYPMWPVLQKHYSQENTKPPQTEPSS